MFSIFSVVLAGLVLGQTSFAESRVRKLEVQVDQVVPVRTAIGVATIIQVPDRPNSIVVGDLSAFKVEYLDQAITIKPLRFGAKSNLYVYTDYRRFNVQLLTTNEPSADYVVYLENPKEKLKPSTLKWEPLSARMSNEDLVFEIRRIAKTKDGVLLIEFFLASVKPAKFQPEWIWLTQGGLTRPIHNLSLSGQDMGPSRAVTGVMQVLKNDINPGERLRIELRRKKISHLDLKAVNSWK